MGAYVAEIFPQDYVLRFREHFEGDPTVEFRLVYQGPLPASGRGDSRAKEKQLIRKSLHPQLRSWWANNRSWLGDSEQIAGSFAHNGFRFVPVLRESQCPNCSVHILFLRRERPGLVVRGGDIDNRLKTLFDGLRMPIERSELGGTEPGDGEDPFFCLLRDDSMITEVHVITDQLLIPAAENEREGNVHLIIQVKADWDLARDAALNNLQAMQFMQRRGL